MGKEPVKKKRKSIVPRPTPESHFAKVCFEIASGKTLRTTCKQPDMPSMKAVLSWMAADKTGELGSQYAKAKAAQMEAMAEEIAEIADEDQTKMSTTQDGTIVTFDSVAVARNRLRVDTRKWLMSKLAPKKYGDKVTQEHTGAGGGPIKINVSFTKAGDDAG